MADEYDGFIKKLKQARKDSGLSQEQVDDKLKIEQPVILMISQKFHILFFPILLGLCFAIFLGAQKVWSADLEEIKKLDQKVLQQKKRIASYGFSTRRFGTLTTPKR